MNTQQIPNWKTLDASIVFKMHKRLVEDNKCKQILLRLLKNIFLKPHCYDVKNEITKEGLLFFYSADYYRADHIEKFLNVTKCVTHANVIVGKQRKATIKNISLSYAIRHLLLIPSLKKYHKQTMKNTKNFWKMLPFYLTLEDQWNLLSSLDMIHCKGLVVYYDAWFTDAAFVQAFKQMGKKTATLQHAFFAAQTEKSMGIGEKGVELECTNADYFLAWNEATVIEAKKQGVDTSKFYILGIPQYLNQNLQYKSFETDCNINKFGVVLGVKDNELQNIRMIEIANEIAEKYQMNYVLKYHPAFFGNEYDKWTKKEFYAGNVKTGISLETYTNTVQFSIAGNSTVMMELLYLKHKTYHYTDYNLYEKYTQMKEITFSDFKEFDIVYHQTETAMESVRLRYCGPSDAKQKYQEFFQKKLC